MITLDATRTIYVDIDETLVLWGKDGTYTLNPAVHTKILEFRARKHSLIAWSKGGAKWAERVIKEFKLEQHFLAAIAKPDWFIDDLPSKEFMGDEIRIDPVELKEAKYGVGLRVPDDTY